MLPSRDLRFFVWPKGPVGAPLLLGWLCLVLAGLSAGTFGSAHAEGIRRSADTWPSAQQPWLGDTGAVSYRFSPQLSLRGSFAGSLGAQDARVALSSLAGVPGNSVGVLLDWETGIRGLRLSGGAIYTEARIFEGRVGATAVGATPGEGPGLGLAPMVQGGLAPGGGAEPRFASNSATLGAAPPIAGTSARVLFPTVSIGYDRPIAENWIVRAEAGGILVSGFGMADDLQIGDGVGRDLPSRQVALEPRPSGVAVHPFLTISIGLQF